MIKIKLDLVEFEMLKNPIQNQEKLSAVQNIKKLIEKIDFEAEVVPMQNKTKLNKLLISLKGSFLTEEESKIIEELVV
ncbi:MAG: hypothetical protein HON09_05185 [Flavobacteriaceae bacterium]|jgi:hypothetical protein|nr:hypothetical protein [Flavobacteriaceae bacterium]|tara:strand:+ start:649 stop:882 length:234 start_codon:yes stop_codon:yes gene_type:complete